MNEPRPPQPSLRVVGDTGWLLEIESTGDPLAAARRVIALAQAIREAAPPGVVDLVPAARTVLVTTTVAQHGRLGAALSRIGSQHDPAAVPHHDPLAVPATSAQPPVLFSIAFDGADLAQAEDLTGRSPADLVATVIAVTWTVAFCGFTPGFGYLVGAGLDVPRLPTPRPLVPAGSLALAGPYAAIYPRSGPGGWRLIGRLVGATALFDPGRTPPALLAPGTEVRFERVE